MIHSRQDLKAVRRMVVKIGSSLLTDARTAIRMDRIQEIAWQVHQLQKNGVQVCLVSSGSVSLGRVHLGWLNKPLSVHEKQAAAAVGQPWLMSAYREAFAAYDMQVAQMLLTKDDLRHRRRYLNASNTSETLFSAGVIPIVNENDTVVVEEIKFGDNDCLGALVSMAVHADLLVMMTDVDGLFDANPNQHPDAKRCSIVPALNDDIMSMAGGAGSEFGTGGMLSKLKASDIATRGGVLSAIISGQGDGALSRFMQGEDIGTLFLCGEDRQTRHQHWIADILKVVGQVYIDAGAAEALWEAGASLLPIGIQSLHGRFDKGECIEVLSDQGVVARGLSNYNAEDLGRIMGKSSQEIVNILGYMDFSSVIHRDNLVLMGKKA
ncbi:MAG: glutamate 5-kinase [Mariprofundaceae bacterium]|nr:glutamate 5-kinase [Mariprofundaceae bacterium]